MPFLPRPARVGALVWLTSCGVAGPGPVVLQPHEHCADYSGDAVVTFADANLGAAVATLLEVGSAELITCARAAALYGIGVPMVGSLEGIQNLTGLLRMWTMGGPITDLRPLANLTDLRELGVSSSWVSDVSPLGGLTSLESLRLERNNISTISPLSGLVRLRELNLEDNAVTDLIPLAPLTSLGALDVSGNSISDLSPLAGLTELARFMADNNEISDISALEVMTGLWKLALSDNDIVDLSALEGLEELDELELSGNSRLTDIQPLLDNPGLRTEWDGGYAVPDVVDLQGTGVSCSDVQALEAKGVTVRHTCG